MPPAVVDTSPPAGRLKPWKVQLFRFLIPACIAAVSWGFFGMFLYSGESSMKYALSWVYSVGVLTFQARCTDAPDELKPLQILKESIG